MSKCVQGYRISKAADGYSENTLRGYQTHFDQLISFAGDKEIAEITSHDLRNFMVWLRQEYKPRRMSGDQSPYHSTTIRNAWCAIRSLFKWAGQELQIKRPDLELKMPKVSYPEIVPFTQEEVEALLKACDQTKQVVIGDKLFKMKRPTSQRDRLLIMTLLDTGIRVTECANLRIKDINQTNGEVFIRPLSSSRKNKSRTLRIGSATRKLMWSYLNKREETYPEDPVFLTDDDRPMNRGNIRLLFIRLGKRACVSHVFPHRFRHTFAIQFLRNGGDVFSLQQALGHSDWTMTRHYANLAQSDYSNTHRRASPVDNWRL